MNEPDIIAAGAVVLRRDPDPLVLLVHRPRYDDWSLPKGKVNGREPLAVCAVREVAEETGARVRLTVPLGFHTYPLAGSTKRVHWWAAELVEAGQATASTDEVDQARWAPVEDALRTLPYSDDRERLACALAQPVTTPLLIVRHAKAMRRADWDGPDAERPITDWGRRQSRALVSLLAAFGVRRVVSSSATRCLQTVIPYARAAGTGLEGWNVLSEEQAEADPESVTTAMRQLSKDVVSSRTPAVVCGHRPVLPTMLAALNVPNQKFATAELLAVTLRTDLTVHSSERVECPT